MGVPRGGCATQTRIWLAALLLLSPFNFCFPDMFQSYSSCIVWLQNNVRLPSLSCTPSLPKAPECCKGSWSL